MKLPDLDKFRSRIGRTFSLRDRNRAYKLTFRSPHGIAYVLPDVMEYGRVLEPVPPGLSEYERGVLEGRRQFALRILEHLSCTPEEQYQLLLGRASLKPEDFNHGG